MIDGGPLHLSAPVGTYTHFRSDAIGFAAVHTSVEAAKYDRSRQAELQRMLGDRGTVLPRQKHGTVQRPAQGWYAELGADREVVFLGDYTSLAGVAIQRILEDA